MRLEPLVDAVTASQAVETCRGDHQRIHLARIETPHARVDVAMERHDAQVGPRGAHESRTARTVGADGGSRSQRSQRLATACGHQRVACVGALRVGRDDQLRLFLEGDVFRAVDGEIDLAADQRAHDGRDENAFTGNRVHRPNVALGHDPDQFHLVTCRAQASGEQLALSQRQGRAARANPDLHRARSSQAPYSSALSSTSLSASLMYAPGRGRDWRYMSSMPRKPPLRRRRTAAGTACGADMSAIGAETGCSSVHGPPSATATAAARPAISAPASSPTPRAEYAPANRSARRGSRLATTTSAPATASE